MIILYIILGIILLLLLIVLIPLKLEIMYETIDEAKKPIIDKIVEKKIRNNYLKIYIFGFLPLPKIKLKVKKNVKFLEMKNLVRDIINTIFSLTMEFIGYEKTSKALLSKKDLNKINNSMFFKQINLNFGFNLQNIILNVYLIAIVNSLLSIFIGKNSERIDLTGVKYDTYISSQIYNLKIFSILKFNLANTIFVFIKVFIKLKKYRKVASLNGKRGTSNRRFNDDSYDVA